MVVATGEAVRCDACSFASSLGKSWKKYFSASRGVARPFSYFSVSTSSDLFSRNRGCCSGMLELGDGGEDKTYMEFTPLRYRGRTPVFRLKERIDTFSHRNEESTGVENAYYSSFFSLTLSHFFLEGWGGDGGGGETA